MDKTEILAIVAIVAIVALFLMPFWSLWIMRRNERVSEFRTRIIESVSQTAQKRLNENRTDWEAPFALINKHSYDDMLYSFKPLKLKDWFTPEEIRLLNEHASPHIPDSR